MSLDLSSSSAQGLADKLAPYAQQLLHRAAKHAHRLFADEIVPEHLLTTMMADDDCAAYHAVIFAFADPQTIGRELLALSPGILVVSSAHSLPFSPFGVRALFRARKLAFDRSEDEVGPIHLMSAAFDELDRSLTDKLVAAGFDRTTLSTDAEIKPVNDSSISLEDALFASFGEETRRILGVAGKLARQNQREAISPAHLLGACVQRQPVLAGRAKLNAMQLSSTIGHDDADESSPAPRAIRLEKSMLDFLAAVPPSESGLSSLDLLRGFWHHGSGEVRDILKRNRVTPELIERVAGSYKDPETTAE